MRHKTSIHVTRHPSRWEGLCGLLLLLLLAVSCSESDDADSGDEYANWQVRNDAYFATLEDSLSRGGSAWRKIKTFTKDPSTPGTATDYVYVKVLESGAGTTSPLYSDSVRVSYRGRLIPSVTYPQGYVFDQTYVGTYDVRTTGVCDEVTSSFREGFATALQYMHKGDRWRVYIPYVLGYDDQSQTGIPAYSVLVFDVALIDFVSGGGSLVPWTSRLAR